MAVTPRPAKVQLCPTCRHDGGWHYPDDGEPFRCPNLLNQTPVRDAEAERDAAITAAGGDDLLAKAHALRIVKAVCEARYEVSANEVRPGIDAAGLSRTLIAGAMRRAKSNGWLKVCGQVISLDPGTHKKLIDNHTSSLFPGPARATGGAA